MKCIFNCSTPNDSVVETKSELNTKKRKMRGGRNSFFSVYEFLVILHSVAAPSGKGISPNKTLLRLGLDITPTRIDFTSTKKRFFPRPLILVISQEHRFAVQSKSIILRHVFRKSEATQVMSCVCSCCQRAEISSSGTGSRRYWQK